MKTNIYSILLYTVIGFALSLSAFLLMADNVSPFTTQATFYKSVVNIAPEVSGNITHVYISNGQHVNANQPLFSIDPKPYQIAVDQAQAELQQAKEANIGTWQQLVAAQQVVLQKKTLWKNAQIKLDRYQALSRKGLTTQQELDDAISTADVAKSAISAAQADVLKIKATLSGKENTAAVELAQAKLARAEWDLSNTTVVAQTAGTVSNLQLDAGTYVNKGTPILFLVNAKNSWLSADFNEKGIAHLQPKNHVLISFDSQPGRVFKGEIENQDRAIFDASNPLTQLSTVTNDTRWIREQQKIRTRIAVNVPQQDVISGSRASVIVLNGNPILDVLNNAWIHLIALFRYIY
ncbi:HlyD family secretion protein [Photobacterium sp. GB-27]|uniref:HlyD family secretion protein n=1 Tax=Photobacterium sp. GB-27 TaxID=2022109 RepID=UPI000D16E9B4|nr:HlyD family secretion protein [Photobacterium sp. GB-27]PSV33793.1 HlyD family secretion protein [Photobacterium sp. GB-27]